MKKNIFLMGLYLGMLAIGIVTVSAQQVSMINIKGKVMSSLDSITGIKAKISYEKLPYYDDYGEIRTSDDGAFSFYLVKGKKYKVSILSDNFVNQSFDFEVNENREILEQNFYLDPTEQPEIFVLEGANFARGSEKLLPGSFESLDYLVEVLKKNPEMIIQLEGHTDFAGNAQANMRLSEDRVETVKDYIQKQGINKKRIMTKAFGGTQPLSRERTREAMRQNRRVEVRIIKN